MFLYLLGDEFITTLTESSTVSESEIRLRREKQHNARRNTPINARNTALNLEHM